MKSPEMGMGEPGNKIPEHDEEIKSKAVEQIKIKLENINIGSYTADKLYDGGIGEDLFGEPNDLEQVLDKVEKIIDESVAKNWTREKFINELSQIKLNFDYSEYEHLDNFRPFFGTEEMLQKFINLDRIADTFYQ